jgi:hypothetical protein
MRQPACRRRAQLPFFNLNRNCKLHIKRKTVVSLIRKNQHMSRTRKLRFSTRQRLSALVCFVALVLIYAPIATSTVMAITGACCSGDQCPIHGNHHHSQKSHNPPMDCDRGEHHMSTMDNCSMSCCQNTEQPAVHCNLFLLTPVPVSASLAPLSATSLTPTATGISRAYAPPAPPPKFAVT